MKRHGAGSRKSDAHRKESAQETQAGHRWHQLKHLQEEVRAALGRQAPPWHSACSMVLCKARRETVMGERKRNTTIVTNSVASLEECFRPICKCPRKADCFGSARALAANKPSSALLIFPAVCTAQANAFSSLATHAVIRVAKK